ncbi:MAG: bifunctional oligoribonuclease/PAP phosphatase NrnA [Candidatus Marinimicrobia bacterium]|nr:bifunctional oligoribonuclease/PAP phosphatase NrnA [Candidatus Neomarinimicrobiota bacterium]
MEIINKKISENYNILITSHVRPDGDALGSEAAMYHLLKRIKKNPQIYNASPLPWEFGFLNENKIFHHYNRAKDKKSLSEFDLAIVLDVGSFSRLGELGDDLKESGISVICLDHHPIRSHEFDYEVVDTRAAATCSLIYELIMETNPHLMNLDIANAIWVGIMTDTGSFRFENTTPKTMKIAARLLDFGVTPGALYRHIYENKLPEQMLLLGMVLQNVKYACDGQLAWFFITQEMARKAGAKIEEVDGYTDFVRTTYGVEVAIMFLEREKKNIRLNFRSKGNVVLNEIAGKHDGGGHAFASGATIFDTIEEAEKLIIPEAQQEIKDWQAGKGKYAKSKD